MGKLKRRAVFAITVLLFLMVICACGAARQGAGSSALAAASVPSSSGIIFLEHSLVANGTLIKGEAPARSINFPTYWYNGNTRQINGKVDFAVNDSLLIVFGDAVTLQGDIGSGTENKLFGVYGLPYMANQDVIYSTDHSGNVVMRIGKKKVVLGPGDTYAYSDRKLIREDNDTLAVLYNHTYVNHGFIDKVSIGTNTAVTGHRRNQ